MSDTPEDGWKGHSRWCRQIVVRRVGNMLTYALAQGAAGMLAPHLERSWDLFHHSEIAHARAQQRLARSGLIAEITRKGEIVLELTPEGEAALPPFVRPTREWDRTWNGIWYFFCYDVPESHRHHRDVIRAALRQRRFGQFQKSMWIGPWDIRPWFDDLRQAAGITDYGMLFEARTVMGIADERLVMQAWPWDDIDRAQTAYLHEAERTLEGWRQATPSADAVKEAIRGETMAYIQAMRNDPLLPRRLWPRGYRGEQVFAAHADFLKTASRLTRTR